MKKAVLAVLFVSLVACAGPGKIPIDQAMSPTLKGKSLSLVTHESPGFVAMTYGKGMFAVAGVGAAVAAGNELVKESRIVDPAQKIGNLLTQHLGSRYGLSVKGQSSKKAESYDIAEVVKLAGGSDYVLDVATNGWNFIYDGFHFSDYLVGYSVKVRLIDVANAKTIAEGFSTYDTKSAGKPPVSYEKLLENNAAYIKEALEDATAHCVEKFKTELFGG